MAVRIVLLNVTIVTFKNQILMSLADSLEVQISRNQFGVCAEKQNNRTALPFSKLRLS
jgi:hypothetical protein